ncbi:progesterone receptor-like [Sinocyclocheilus rhinocerous]|uniref:Progesterone receptor-like n=1 Tax=Sinocyclocheilus rhinocerous TaxID=307959 RepID=A0A673MRK5_9TELE|nr:PREDICTED: progesterone receptor-like [Sinocyclocheilus rhinocerous]
METKTNSRMDTVNTSLADSTEMRTGISSLIEKFTDESLGHGRVFVRNFGDAESLCSSAPGSSSDGLNQLSFLDLPLGTKTYTDQMDEFLKVESGQWSAKALLPKETDVSESAFIKDENEQSLIMEPPNTDFDLGLNISALESCYDPAEKKQQCDFIEDSSTLLSSQAAKQVVVDSYSLFQLDMNQSTLLLPTPRRVSPFLGRGMLNFDGASAATTMSKTDISKWVSPAESPFWYPTTNEELAGYSSPDGFISRSQTVYTAFPGVPAQRLCVICGEEASGCHYGVLTCGSCKVFFKRAVEGHHNYLCAGRNDCIVDKIRRKNCPACRLRKCYQAGMMLGGRKMKRFAGLKVMGLNPSLMFQGPLSLLADGQTVSSMPCMPVIRELQLSLQMISILESIEPQMVYSGYDSSQPELPHLLLNSLNRLCERQLLCIVRWTKSLPGFRNLHINDQMTLIQYSWMGLMLFSLGWRTFQNVTTDYLYFAPDLVLSQDQMRRSPIYDLCLAMQFVPQEFANLQVTKEEFLCMKALMLLNTVPLEGLRSQTHFDEMRQNYICELTKAIQLKEKGVVASSQRFYHLTKIMDAMHEIAKKFNLYCLSTYIQADAMRVEFPEMMSEVIASQLPKVLAGMVKPLMFHNK